MRKETNSEKRVCTRRSFLKIAGISAGALAANAIGMPAFGAARDVYPAKKITFIIPHQAGGAHDMFARTLSIYITKYLKQLSPGCKGGDIVIRNESGGGGRKGHSLLFNSRPDGRSEEHTSELQS